MKCSFFIPISALWLLTSSFSPAIVDVNENGLSDFWERQYNAEELFAETFDPQADYDADGWTNAQEAAAGTNPYDPNPPDGFIRPATAHVPAVMGEENGVPVVITPEAVTVSWPTLTGKQYTLLFSPDLSQGSWIPVEDPFIANGSEVTYNFPISQADKCFWRVAVTDVDTDGDGLTDYEEDQSGSNPASADSDDDGLSDKKEAEIGTDLNAPDTDDDEAGDAEDAVPLDSEINWSKTPENRYVWIEQVTRTGAKAVSRHGHILFPQSNGGSSDPSQVLWDSNTSTYVSLTGASSWSGSGFISGNTPDVFDAEWMYINDMNDDGAIVGKSEMIGPYAPVAWVWASAIMKWQMAGTATDQYADPIYIVPGFEYVDPVGDLEKVLFDFNSNVPRIADDGTVSALSYFVEAGDLPIDIEWVGSAAQLASHSNEMAAWASFGSDWDIQYHCGALIGNTGGLLVEHDPSVPKTVLHYRNGAAAESLEGLLPSTAYGIFSADIGRTPATSESPEGRIWFSVNHAGGDAAFLEKRAGGSGVSRWHNPPSMGEGAIRLNARGEAITSGRSATQTAPAIPPKIWRNGKYTDLNDGKLTSKPETVTITEAIDLASNGIILAQADDDGVTKTGLLIPVEVSWEAIAGFDNVDDHIDPWDKPIHGKCIFPDFKNPDDTTIRHKLQLIVKTSPVLAGKTVYVKAFDVDDSTSEEFDKNLEGTAPVIDTNGKAGGDNLPDYLNTETNGQFWDEDTSAWGGRTMTGVVDANGETKFDFRVGMQPGNNYRVVASVNDESMYDGVQASDPAADKYLGPEPTQTGGASVSPLLTVWRRLWVENDSMDAVNETDSTKTNANFFPVTVEVVVPDSHETSIPDPGQVVVTEVIPNASAFYENGFFRPDSGGVWKVKKTRFLSSQSHIVTYGVPTNVVGSAKLFDDDGRGLISPQLPRLDLVNDQMKETFRPSFIEITDAADYNPNKLIAFKANEDAYPTDTMLDDASDLADTPSLWVCTLVAAYQGAEEVDQDPNGNDESNRLGETSGFNGNDQFSVVYVETCRENYWSPFLSDNQQTIENSRIRLEKFIIAVSSHEMGHHPGTQTEEQDHSEKQLMSKSMEEVNPTSPETSDFSPKTISRFRKAKRWAD